MRNVKNEQAPKKDTETPRDLKGNAIHMELGSGKVWDFRADGATDAIEKAMKIAKENKMNFLKDCTVFEIAQRSE
jgi:hypothetical protein